MSEAPYQPSASPPSQPSSTGLTSEERTMAMLCHLLAIVLGYLTGLGFAGPLIIWLMKKDESRFVDYHGKESLNFQLTVLLVMVGGGIAAFILTFVFVGILLFIVLLVLAVLALVAEILGCVAAYRGEWFRYPCCIRFIS